MFSNTIQNPATNTNCKKFLPTHIDRMERPSNHGVIFRVTQRLDGRGMISRAEQYRQLARDFHFMARSLPHGQNRSTLLNMAEECERLADQQEQTTDLRAGRSKRASSAKSAYTRFVSNCTRTATTRKPSTT